MAAHEESGTASWDALGVERVVTALPDAALEDLPDGLRRLLAGDQSLVRTLEAYLDHAGDVKRTAAALSLHRGGLYYRLRRIEEVAGVNLHDGEDRLSCHLASAPGPAERVFRRRAGGGAAAFELRARRGAGPRRRTLTSVGAPRSATSCDGVSDGAHAALHARDGDGRPRAQLPSAGWAARAR